MSNNLDNAKLYNNVLCEERLWASTKGGPDLDLEYVAEDLVGVCGNFTPFIFILYFCYALA